MNIVDMLGITKQFGVVTANDNVDFHLRPREIHALLGENGAGKTTLMRILYGLYHQDAGIIKVSEKQVDIRSPKDAIANRIGMVTQHFALVPPLSVTENVILGYNNEFTLNRKELEEKVGAAAKQFDMDIDPRALVRHLSVAQRQRVEILKALYRNARVLILDEPTAVLVPQEVYALFETLNRLKEEGLSVIFISHKLWEVTQITDRVTVLRDGKVIGTVNTADVSQGELATMMVGRETFGVSRQAPVAEECHSLLDLQNVSANDDRGVRVLKNITFCVNNGEILGVAGVGGNGQKELAEVLSGVRPLAGGRIILDGRDLTGCSPVQFNDAGMGRIPEDRHEGIVGDLSVTENLALEHVDEFSTNGVLNRRMIRKNAEDLIQQYQIKARPNDAARTLSGGNMQKMLLARVLSRQPKLVIAPQPTRGLDVGATDYVRQQLLEQSQRGAGVLLISEDLDEILALSDRIAVIYEGEIVGLMPASEATPERLGLLMSGALKEG